MSVDLVYETTQITCKSGGVRLEKRLKWRKTSMLDLVTETSVLYQLIHLIAFESAVLTSTVYINVEPYILVYLNFNTIY